MNKVKTQSSELKTFYGSYLQWVQAGAPVDNPYGFHRGAGLCQNLLWFYLPDDSSSFEVELILQFQRNNLYAAYPFGMTDYTLRTRNQSHHECPKRMAWVCMMVNVPEED